MKKFKYISRDYPLILASSSPRRRELLQNLGIPFKIYPSNVEEKISDTDEFEKFALEIAEKKARYAYNKLKDGWILAADTIVVVEEKIFGKPKDYNDAKRMLSILSGREHTVITGFCIIDPAGELSWKESVISKVTIRELTEEEIDSYLATKEPFDKAGAYAVQGIGSFMIKKINGSYTNVVGLPVCEVILALKKIKAVAKFP
ncbi:MAG: septum formation protein Maf [Deltaproteobacteria bacterium]|nr:MAG: septum formation protein Maf [Deltaproteobacteria bacterium]